MKMSDRSVFSALSLFVVIVVGLTLSPGNAALAVEEDHGNPGQFIDNNRKGISGLSKYFWSPKAPIPGENIEQPAKGDKTLAPNTKLPEVDAKKANKTKEVTPAITAPAAIAKKPAGKPVQKIKPDNKVVRVPTNPKTTFESKTAIEHKNKMGAPKKPGTIAAKTQPTTKPVLKITKPALALKSAPNVKPAQKASGSSLKAHAQPTFQSPAIANARKKSAKQPATGKITSLVTPRTIVKNKPASAKPAAPMAPVGKTAKDKKPVGLTKQKTAQKPMAKKSAAVSVQSKTPSSKKAAAGTIVAASAKTSKQQLVPNDKGTYIWVPNIGSQLSQRFGLTGIPAKGLHANGGLNRTDGRWAFAPKKRGMLPSIYGLSAEIHAAGDAGVWVGGGRNWVYVFDKNRSYGSIVGGAKAKKKSAPKSAKPVASLKSGTPKSGTVGAQKPAKLQKGIEVQKATKKPAQGSAKKTVTKPLTKSAGQAKASPKAARNGKWSRINNRWVFVPQSQPGQMKSANMRGLAEQVAKAPVIGGWVQRQNRWVYIAPQQGNTGPAANRFKRVQKGTARTSTLPATAKKMTAEQKAAKKPLASAQSAKPGFATVQKPIVKMTPKASAATGLAEGPDAGEPQATKNQKIWVRKNNKWVYVFATPATKAQQVPQAKRPQGTRIARSNSAQRNASRQSAPKQGLVTRAGKKPLGEFMFFVPGSTPGTGSWFIAPLQMLEKAKKIKRPSFAGGR